VPRTSACLALLLGLPHLPVAPSWHRTPHLMRPQQHFLSSLCYFELLVDLFSFVLPLPPAPPLQPNPNSVIQNDEARGTNHLDFFKFVGRVVAKVRERGIMGGCVCACACFGREPLYRPM
jgi:hypothetical protein